MRSVTAATKVSAIIGSLLSKVSRCPRLMLSNGPSSTLRANPMSSSRGIARIDSPTPTFMSVPPSVDLGRSYAAGTDRALWCRPPRMRSTACGYDHCGGGMILCSCRGVNDRVVRTAIEAGARTVEEVGERCRAGSRCGGCRPALQEILAEYGLAEPTEGPRRATYAAV